MKLSIQKPMTDCSSEEEMSLESWVLEMSPEIRRKIQPSLIMMRQRKKHQETTDNSPVYRTPVYRTPQPMMSLKRSPLLSS